MTQSHRVWRVRDRPDFDGPLLLDTHAWVWMLSGDLSRMNRHVPELLERVATGAGLFVSEISCWEVAQKAAAGRLRLALPIETWIDRATRAPGVRMVPLDRATLLHGAALVEMHGDTADRWIVATSRLNDLTLLTADRVIIEFGRRERLTRIADGRR